ncbi:hypothetical protein KC19_6G120000 [Ceratodon purpureus]|uniref:Uncharacterized protein n=1 Tax=Ceratodon purpureus TaxID=3225 RepID=A0A8T0HIT5_CERPU|nr:hypothetical protein KC19_6G120000 [Ceratodon purpureus]
MPTTDVILCSLRLAFQAIPDGSSLLARHSHQYPKFLTKIAVNISQCPSPASISRNLISVTSFLKPTKSISFYQSVQHMQQSYVAQSHPLKPCKISTHLRNNIT